jgi:nicotinate-nucleotide adenylyltransferase
VTAAGSRRHRIGVFGGTFDPVHNGHLRSALELRESLGLDEIRMIPAALPPHRDPPRASGAQRLAMLRLATAGCEGLIPDDRELRRGGTSYMVETLQSLREELGAEAALCLILGRDAFSGLRSWLNWERLIELAHIVVVERPGALESFEPELNDWLSDVLSEQPDEELRRRSHGTVFRIQLTQLEISATHIRALVGAGRSARFLLPQSVLDYVERNGLYRDGHRGGDTGLD